MFLLKKITCAWQIAWGSVSRVRRRVYLFFYQRSIGHQAEQTPQGVGKLRQRDRFLSVMYGGIIIVYRGRELDKPE